MSSSSPCQGTLLLRKQTVRGHHDIGDGRDGSDADDEKYSEKRNYLSWLLKEERVAECLMSLGRLFQMWGPKCEKVRKPWVLQLKRWILSMRVSDEERRERKDCKGVAAQKDKRERCDCVVTRASSFVFYPFRNWEPVELL